MIKRSFIIEDENYGTLTKISGQGGILKCGEFYTLEIDEIAQEAIENVSVTTETDKEGYSTYTYNKELLKEHIQQRLDEFAKAIAKDAYITAISIINDDEDSKFDLDIK